jgi:threonine dehydratase
VPDCKTLVFPVGGGGLLMGLTAYFRRHPAPVRLVGCEAHNAPTYVPFEHARSATIADGLILEVPHPVVQQRIKEDDVALHLVTDAAIRAAMRALYETQALAVEPSSAITVACVQERPESEEPVCVVLTGENIARDDFFRLIATDAP